MAAVLARTLAAAGGTAASARQQSIAVHVATEPLSFPRLAESVPTLRAKSVTAGQRDQAASSGLANVPCCPLALAHPASAAARVYNARARRPRRVGGHARRPPPGARGRGGIDGRRFDRSVWSLHGRWHCTSMCCSGYTRTTDAQGSEPLRMGLMLRACVLLALLSGCLVEPSLASKCFSATGCARRLPFSRKNHAVALLVDHSSLSASDSGYEHRDPKNDSAATTLALSSVAAVVTHPHLSFISWCGHPIAVHSCRLTPCLVRPSWPPRQGRGARPSQKGGEQRLC